MASLKSIEGGFSETSQYNLKQYDEYLNNLVKQVVKLQKNVKMVSTQIKGTVMVKGKWYDDAASEFALWWNNTTAKSAGLADGMDKLNNISTVAEELVRITAVDVCEQMKKSKKFGKSYQKHAYITKFAKGNVYIDDIENITKKTLGNIPQIKCDPNADMVADKQSLANMINKISSSFDHINEAIQKIKQLVQSNLIDGKALKLKGLSPEVLRNKVKRVQEHLNAISDKLYKILKENQGENNLTDSQLKKALSTNYTKGNTKTHSSSSSASNSSGEEPISEWERVN